MKELAQEFIELKVPSKPEYVSVVRALITDIANRMAFSQSAIEDLQVAVSEACANVVRHAYADPNDDAAEIVFRCCTGGRRLVMEVVDTGQGFMASRPTTESERFGGYGLVLMRKLMDNVSLDSSPERGTIVRMVKKPRLRTVSHSAERS